MIRSPELKQGINQAYNTLEQGSKKLLYQRGISKEDLLARLTPYSIKLTYTPFGKESAPSCVRELVESEHPDSSRVRAITVRWIPFELGVYGPRWDCNIVVAWDTLFSGLTHPQYLDFEKPANGKTTGICINPFFMTYDRLKGPHSNHFPEDPSTQDHPLGTRLKPQIVHEIGLALPIPTSESWLDPIIYSPHIPFNVRDTISRLQRRFCSPVNNNSHNEPHREILIY